MNRYDVMCIGQACIDMLQKDFPLAYHFETERCYPKSIELSVGGDALNEAKALASMGYSLAILCALGEDEAANFICSKMDEAGIDHTKALRFQDAKTPVSSIFVRENGERCIALGRDSVYFLPHMEIPENCFDGVKVVSLASLFLQPLCDPKGILRVVQNAKEAGATVCMDIRARQEINLMDYALIFPYVDYIFPNDEEAVFYSSEKNLEKAADYFLRLGVQNIVVKHGKEGCFAKSSTGVAFWTPAYLTEVVDTTGAGDNFAAGFISGLLDQESFERCCKRGCAAAHLAVQKVGAFGVIESKEQLLGVVNSAENKIN